MKYLCSPFLLSCLLLCPVTAQVTPLGAPAPLRVVASLDHQATGVAVSKSGRLFACFPYWADSHTYSVAELTPNHPPRPYPTRGWNNVLAAGIDPNHHFVCVQSVYVDGNDKLWILDAAAPEFHRTVNGAKLVEVDLASNTVERIYPVGPDLAPSGSYLNDVRIDLKHHQAFISESGIGSIIVIDLRSGQGRRLLAHSPQTKGTPDFVLQVNGQPLQTSNGGPAVINCDGIALDPTNTWLYFAASTSPYLYRVSTANLLNSGLTEHQLARRVKLVGMPGPADGIWCGPDGYVYLTSPMDHSVKSYSPYRQGPLRLLADDPRLVWPDSLALSQTGRMYVSASQVNRMPRFNDGQNLAQLPYQIFSFQLH